MDHWSALLQKAVSIAETAALAVHEVGYDYCRAATSAQVTVDQYPAPLAHRIIDEVDQGRELAQKVSSVLII